LPPIEAFFLFRLRGSNFKQCGYCHWYIYFRSPGDTVFPHRSCRMATGILLPIRSHRSECTPILLGF
ncbi:hypothetical protein PISMIDRAFT_679333, partial [Pisolithus microcarpus 441]